MALNMIKYNDCTINNWLVLVLKNYKMNYCTMGFIILENITLIDLLNGSTTV